MEIIVPMVICLAVLRAISELQRFRCTSCRYSVNQL